MTVGEEIVARYYITVTGEETTAMIETKGAVVA